MKAQHTPGPWHIGRTITGSEEDIQLSGLTGDGAKKYDCFVVAPAYTVAGVGGIGKEECRANARLIAAAPDLEKSLCDLLEWAKGNRGDRNVNPYCVSEVRQALKVLANLQGIKDPFDAVTAK